MTKMSYLKAKKKSAKGFTLMEMLIVIAIIAILIAIAIPVFSAQLNKASDRVNEANARSAKSMAYSQYLLDSVSTDKTYYAVIDANDNMTIVDSVPTTSGVEYYTVSITAGSGATAGTVTVSDTPTKVS